MTQPPVSCDPGTSLEFVATFGADRFQHVGLNAGGDTWDRYILISTFGTTDRVYARTPNFRDTEIPVPGLIGTSHRYRIRWNANSVDFYVDGVLRVTQDNVSLSGPMVPLISDYNSATADLVVDWMRVSPYGASGSFTSRIYDSGASATWSGATWTTDPPASPQVTIDVRTGNILPAEAEKRYYAMLDEPAMAA